MLNKLKGMAASSVIFAVFLTFIMALFIWSFDVRPLLTVNLDQRVIDQGCVANNPKVLSESGFFLKTDTSGVSATGWPFEAYSFDFMRGCSYDWHPMSLLIDLVILYFANRLIMRAYRFFVEGE